MGDHCTLRRLNPHLAIISTPHPPHHFRRLSSTSFVRKIIVQTRSQSSHSHFNIQEMTRNNRRNLVPYSWSCKKLRKTKKYGAIFPVSQEDGASFFVSSMLVVPAQRALASSPLLELSLRALRRWGRLGLARRLCWRSGCARPACLAYFACRGEGTSDGIRRKKVRGRKQKTCQQQSSR